MREVQCGNGWIVCDHMRDKLYEEGGDCPDEDQVLVGLKGDCGKRLASAETRTRDAPIYERSRDARMSFHAISERG